jgi:hypothetical protein
VDVHVMVLLDVEVDVVTSLVVVVAFANWFWDETWVRFVNGGCGSMFSPH